MLIIINPRGISLVINNHFVFVIVYYQNYICMSTIGGKRAPQVVICYKEWNNLHQHSGAFNFKLGIINRDDYREKEQKNLRDIYLGITVPKPNSRIMDIFPKNLFEVVKCTQTKNMKNQNFEFGAT